MWQPRWRASQTLALAEYRGLTVAHLDVLRKQARDKGVYLHVLKNTLARRAVAGTPFEVASESMVGPLIYGFSEDAVAAAKVISDFAKGNDKLIVKGGAYAGKALNADGVKSLAAMPSKEVLLTQVARPDAVADLALRARAGGHRREACRSGRRAGRRGGTCCRSAGCSLTPNDRSLQLSI